MAERSGDPLSVVLRSALFHAVSACVSLGFLPLYPLILAPRSVAWRILAVYIGVQLWLLRRICGLDYRVEGQELLPPGPCILASRHDAPWETLVLPRVFGNPAAVLKSEILAWPVVGPITRKLGHIPVSRQGDLEAARRAFRAAEDAVAAGRSVLIFPSGTRDPAHRYRVETGVGVLYRTLGVPCVPIVLNSGDFWPYRSWLRRPGTITVRVLSAIEPGLSARAFLDRLEAAMRTPV